MPEAPHGHAATDQAVQRHLVETYAHIRDVQRHLGRVISDLQERQLVHDASKLVAPEATVFARYPDRVPYGTPHYYARLLALHGALRHHYRNNRHHPEHFEDGVNGMTLMDLIEMLADWWATAERQPGGGVGDSINRGRARFGTGEQLTKVLHNTVTYLSRAGGPTLAR